MDKVLYEMFPQAFDSAHSQLFKAHRLIKICSYLKNNEKQMNE